jgi:predicted secreted acid phosphatase
MKYLKYVTIIAVPLLFAAGCETMNQNDKAMLEKANTSAAEAKSASMKASADARAAAAAARAAADAANRAAAEAKAASDKADRIFQKGLRK